MKEVEIKLWDLTKEDIKKMPKEKQILQYDTLHEKYSIVNAGEESSAVKEDKEYCHYFSFDEENNNDK